ncbi:MAG: hypothetical protein FJ271_16275 [Planctomycetes bacterium]|nr:hypothetical protein [Planctomycetota bacterium]
MATKPLFLDTTIQVDRVLKERPAEKLAALSALLAQFDFHVACSYSRLEFKRVVIQNLSLVLDYLVEDGSFWGAMQRAQVVSGGRSRRSGTLISVLAWIGYRIDKKVEVTFGEGVDRELALRAESYIRNAFLMFGGDLTRAWTQ